MMEHQILDRRMLTYARLTVWLIDHDPERKGFLRAKENLEKLPRNNGYYKWKDILSLPWEKVRFVLRKQTEEMQFLRQMTPFYGEACMPENLRQRVVNKYLLRHGRKPIPFLQLRFPVPVPVDKRRRYRSLLNERTK